MLSPALYCGNAQKNNQFIDQLVLTGHRGAAGLAPENTVASVKKALELKTDRIEVDVRQTKDNRVVCLHDKTIDRTVNGKGAIENINYKNLLKLSAGKKFAGPFKDEKVPTLERILQLVNGQSVLVIEIKDGDELYPGIEKQVVNLIHQNKAGEWVIIHSFDDHVLKRIHELDDEIVLHKLLIADFPLFHLIYDGKFRVTTLEFYDFVDEFSCYYPFTTKRLIRKVHQLGKKINVWTVNDSTLIHRMINLGVDGIITDYPNYIN